MRFDRFLHNRCQEIVLEVNRPGQGFTYWRDGEVKAAQLINSACCWIVATLLIPWVFTQYFLVLFRLRRLPVPVLEMMRAEQERAAHEKKSKAARKAGFQPPDKLPAGIQ